MGFVITFINILTVSSNQLIFAKTPNPAVTSALLCEILLLKSVQCLTWDDVISRIRLRTVPAGYTPHAWKSGTFYCADY